MSCMTYLSFTTLPDVGSWGHHPLIHYAVSNWAYHARETEDGLIIDTMKSFCSRPNNIIRAVRLDLLRRGRKERLSEPFLGIHVAAMYGLRFVTQRLLDEGTPADSRDSSGRTPLMLAAMHGWVGVVETLVMRDDVDTNTSTDPPYSLTPLIMPAQGAHRPVITQLIQHAADVNLCCSRGTALNCAVNRGDISTIKILVEAGADPNIPDEKGVPVVFHAPWLPVLRRYNENQKSRTAVLSLKLLQQYGANLNVRDTLQRTLLHVAAQRCNVAVVQMLLAEGLDPNAVDDFGQTPLHKVRFSQLSDYFSKLATVKVLLDNGSRPDAIDHLGDTALHRASLEK